ncbi:MAG: permease [Rhodospirillaceae bacterium]|nr:permease [Rhodospirillaceae bacterium]
MIIIGLFALASFLSFFLRWDFGLRTANSFAQSLVEMLSFLPAIFILIGLVDAWVPKEIVAKHTGEGSGWKSSLWMMLLAMLQIGPLYAAFPVACLMWKKGTSPRNIFIYLGAFCTLKLPMLGFEVGFLGIKFTMLRTLLSVPVFIIIAIVIDKFFGRNLVINDVSESKGAKSNTENARVNG